jgi:multidrug efflux system membrane fusion protein
MIRPYFRRSGWSRASLIAIATAFLACNRPAPPRKQPPTPVRVAPVERINAPLTLVASGVVEPMQTVSVTAQVSGTLMDVVFKEGDYVEQGQVLFRLDPRQLAAAADQARANLARDDATAAAARKDDERYARLAASGFVSRSQADQFHATAVAADATVEADRAALRGANVNLGFTTLRAPIAGRTGSLLVRRGNNVSPTTGPLVVINQISPVFVRFPILSQDLPNVQRAVASRALPVDAVSTDSAEAHERGELRFLNNEIDSLSGTVLGRATFRNPAHRMWPGELVFLTVQLAIDRGVLAVPTAAVQTGQQGTYVYVVDQRSTAQSRPVTIAQQVESLTVVSRGIALGERVVVDGQSRIRPGAAVSVIRASGDTAAARSAAGSVDTSVANAKRK